MKRALLFLLICLPFWAKAQFPSAPGTVWEYYQHDPYGDPSSPGGGSSYFPAFTDSITRDTVINGTSYHEVYRSGKIVQWADPPFYGIGTDTQDGYWYFRQAGDTVLYLDTVMGSMNVDSVFLDLGLEAGDTAYWNPPSYLDLTDDAPNHWSCYVPGASSTDEWDCYLSIVDYDPFPYVVIPASYHFTESPPMNYVDTLGVVWERSHLLLVGATYYGYDFYLFRLRDPSGEIWVNEDILASNDQIPGQLPFKIYPNPSTGSTFLEVPGNHGQWRVTDVQGRLMHRNDFQKMNMSDRIELDLQALTPGIYFINVKVGSSSTTQKMIISP